MKRPLFAALITALLLAPLCQAEMHQFTSADGQNKLWAEVLAYDAATDTVSLLLSDRRRISSPVAAFSEEDRAHIVKAAVALDAGRNLAVKFDNEQNLVSETKNPTHGYQTIVSENGFKLNLRNNGQTTFSGLQAEYQIFYGAYLDPFADRARSDQVITGKFSLPDLAPREDADLSTSSAKMTSIRRLPPSECVGGT
jgi:hypothetical protein